MMYHEKADVYQEIIDGIIQDFNTSSKEVKDNAKEYVTFVVNNLIKRKAEVDALAEQEAERHAQDVKQDEVQENVMASIPTVGEVSMKELTEMDMTQREEYEMANNLD